MKTLSVKTKITASICLCLLGVFGAMAVTIGHLQKGTLTDLCATNAQDLGWSLSKTVDDIMMNGENEKIQPLTHEIVSNGVLQELTIVDADRVVRRSSVNETIGKPAADSLWIQLFSSRRDTTFSAMVHDTPVQVTYHVFANNEACSQCHDMKEQPILGGMKLARSNQMLAEAVSAGYLTVAGLSLVGILLLVTGIPLLLHRLIFKPIHAVKAKLTCVAEGDIETAVSVKLDDEIGQRLLGIGPLIDYITCMADVSSRIAAGDLTVVSNPKCEKDLLGHACKKMIENLRTVIGQLNDNAQDVAAAARQIAASAEQTSRGATQQSDEVIRISAAVEEMSANIIESSHNAATANSLAREAAATAGNGGDIVASTNQGMGKIAEVVKTSSDSVSRLSSSAEQIGQIINTIDDIADQTNLLALNAAIEAARAGEQGRGFAVVADEVRKLAERTAEATGEITNMIKGIQGETQTAVARMDGGIRQVNAGKEMADRAGASLNEIIGIVQRVSDMIAQMSTAAEEQKQAAEQISANIERISQVTKESATGALQSAAAANQLSRQADTLQEIVAKFRVTS